MTSPDGRSSRQAASISAFTGMLRFSNDVVAQFDAGFRAAFRAEMEIVGTDRILRVERAFKGGPDSRLFLTRGDETAVLPFEPDASYTGEVDDFAAAALDGQPQRVPLAESRRTVDVICRLYRSAARLRADAREHADRLHTQVGQPFQIAGHL